MKEFCKRYLVKELESGKELGYHKLIAIGKALEVIWLIEYALEVEGNGVTAERLQEVEEKYFSHVPQEDRVMPKLAVSTDVAEQRGIKQGLEQGLERGRKQEREQVVLAMLRAKMPEQEICKIVGVSLADLTRLKKRL